VFHTFESQNGVGCYLKAGAGGTSHVINNARRHPGNGGSGRPRGYQKEAAGRKKRWVSVQTGQNAVLTRRAILPGRSRSGRRPEHRVFGKVRVADVAMTPPGLSGTARQGALNRIAFKHFDFVVCRSSDLSIVCAVELNDKSHASERAQARDDLLAKVCQAIGLPLLISRQTNALIERCTCAIRGCHFSATYVGRGGQCRRDTSSERCGIARDEFSRKSSKVISSRLNLSLVSPS